MKRIYLLFSLLITSQLVAQTHRPEIHCKHWIGGYPYGTPATNDLIIRDIYALSNNDDRKFADWVAYRLDPVTIGGPSKHRNWAPDPWLAEDETLEPSPDHGDYKGAYAALKTDRGHQAPLASFDGTPDWAETNYLSNITPQKSALNQGLWKELESEVRDMVNVHGLVYVMTGPLFERDTETLPNEDEDGEVKIPSGYWKIILVVREDEYIEPLAFIFEQTTPRSSDISKLRDHLVTIYEVEQRSGLDFLWDLPDRKENAIEHNKNITWFEQNIKED